VVLLPTAGNEGNGANGNTRGGDNGSILHPVEQEEAGNKGWLINTAIEMYTDVYEKMNALAGHPPYVPDTIPTCHDYCTRTCRFGQYSVKTAEQRFYG
jgi:hypothetical protein